MIDDSRIILINYPSGGFGNFIYHMLSQYSSNTYKVDNSKFEFNSLGNSHSTKKYTPIWHKDPDHYIFPNIVTDKKLLILCDNGINNDSIDKISKKFKSHTVVRLNIDYAIRPVIFATCIKKAMNSNFQSEVLPHVQKHWTDSNEDYAVRENFTLFYHNWPFKWQSKLEQNVINVSIKELIDDPIFTLQKLIINIGGSVTLKRPFEYDCKKWLTANYCYFQIYYQWQQIEKALNNFQKYDLSMITDLHDQGYINYCIERKYNITIPVYDYKNWFVDTIHILDIVNKL